MSCSARDCSKSHPGWMYNELMSWRSLQPVHTHILSQHTRTFRMHVYKNIYFKSNVPIFVHVSSELLAELSVCKPKKNKIIRSLRFAGEPDDERRFMVSTTRGSVQTLGVALPSSPGQTDLFNDNQ